MSLKAKELKRFLGLFFVSQPTAIVEAFAWTIASGRKNWHRLFFVVSKPSDLEDFFEGE